MSSFLARGARSVTSVRNFSYLFHPLVTATSCPRGWTTATIRSSATTAATAATAATASSRPQATTAIMRNREKRCYTNRRSEREMIRSDMWEGVYHFFMSSASFGFFGFCLSHPYPSMMFAVCFVALGVINGAYAVKFWLRAWMRRYKM
jgi:hypothetical protein